MSTALKSAFSAALLLLGAAFGAFAGVETSTDKSNVILAGYDAVAYFTESQPVKGSPDFTADYEGATYQFASAENRDLFQANPAKYAPAYGGYCALGASFGKKFAVDGKAFEIVDGTLYVNKNRRIYKTWSKDVPGNIKKANSNWPDIRSVAPGEL